MTASAQISGNGPRPLGEVSVAELCAHGQAGLLGRIERVKALGGRNLPPALIRAVA